MKTATCSRGKKKSGLPRIPRALGCLIMNFSINQGCLKADFSRAVTLTTNPFHDPGMMWFNVRKHAIREFVA
uniref:Uncharacterized protein n=1 Tax=Candidatus Kentrum sp. SD TaxID=2126332 RepID=A0A451BQJ9_9GAMM|nr:MAG: hypothetical protein BECKSD772D_GA0070982_11215 [Candidatus Kentron sp. SD]